MHVHMHTCIHEWPSVTLIETQDAQEIGGSEGCSQSRDAQSTSACVLNAAEHVHVCDV